MNFPTPQVALDYIREKIRELYAQSGHLTSALVRAGQLKTRAKDRGHHDLALQAETAQGRLRHALTTQLELEQRLQPFADFFGVNTSNLGAVPVLLIGSAIATAVLLASHLAKVYEANRLLDLVEQGMLTVEQAKALKPTSLLQDVQATAAGIGTGAMGIGFLALAGLAALMLWRRGV